MKVRKLFFAKLLVGALLFQGCAVPAWVDTVESDAEVAAPIAASLVDVIDPPLAPVVTLIVNGFNALVKTLDTYEAMPTATNLQAVQSAFEAVNANVTQLEAAAQIKNASTQDKMSAIVQLLAQAVTEMAALVPANAGHVSRIPYPESRSPKGWKAKDFKREFNKIVKGDPRFKPLK